MELQLCEERRQMMDVETRVREKLSALPLLTAPVVGGSSQRKTTKGSETSARADHKQRESGRSGLSQMKSHQGPDNKSKLIKYGDKFRRNCA